MRYEVREMHKGCGEWYIHDREVNRACHRAWPQHHTLRVFKSEAAALRAAKKLEEER